LNLKDLILLVRVGPEEADTAVLQSVGTLRPTFFKVHSLCRNGDYNVTDAICTLLAQEFEVNGESKDFLGN